jgi:predicted HicB family RNase H-like nuclease
MDLAQPSEAVRDRDRVLHIRLAPELHCLVRIAAAENDVTLQEWVKRTLAEAVCAQGIRRSKP